MKKKESRPIELHVERRVGAAIDRYTKERIDAFPIVNTRTGITLRWFLNEQEAEREKEKMLRER